MSLVDLSRQDAIERSQQYFDDGQFEAELRRRVAICTESPEPSRRSELYRYLNDELRAALDSLGFDSQVYENPQPDGGPFLVARRDEGADLPTVMSYGHADVVRGYDDQWRSGLSPWSLVIEGDRWYGRGTADNKGQHTINLAALKTVLELRGHLGFNMVMLFETGEECGSPGLKQFCEQNSQLLAADVFVASDGPRMQPDVPTVFMGSRGAVNFTLRVDLRDGAHHSGNWGGLLANPAVILSHALASMVSASGELLVEGWKAPPMSASVRAAIAKLRVAGGPSDPHVDVDWGEPGMSPEERVYGSNTFEVLAFETGNPANPVNAIPPRAFAHCHLRFVAGSNAADLVAAVRRHLDAQGFANVEVEWPGVSMAATRLDPDHPWARWAVASIERTADTDVAVLPNLGGTLPNDVFADVLGLPTIWIPHSYAGCAQHAPNEHALGSICRQGLEIMTGLWWDLGTGPTPAQS